MKTKKLNLNGIMKYFALGFVCLILAQATISGLSPFLFAFYFACLYVCVDEKLIATFTLISGLTISCTLENFLINVTVVAVGLIIFYIHKFSKRKIHLATIFLSFLVSNITYIYYNYLRYKHLIAFLLLGLICLFVYITVLQVMFLRKNCFKLTLDESVCFLFAIASIGLGLFPVYVLNFSLARFLVALVLLVCVAIGSPSLTYSITLSFALGCALSQLSLDPIAEFVVLAMLASVFSLPNKFKILFMVIVGALILGETAINAGLVSPPAVMIIALSGITFYIIPSQAAQFSILRLLGLVIGAAVGLYGILIFCVFIISYLSSFDSYNSAYLAPTSPFIRDDQKDMFKREIIKEMKKRPTSISNNRKNLKRRSKNEN